MLVSLCRNGMHGMEYAGLSLAVPLSRSSASANNPVGARDFGVPVGQCSQEALSPSRSGILVCSTPQTDDSCHFQRYKQFPLGNIWPESCSIELGSGAPCGNHGAGSSLDICTLRVGVLSFMKALETEQDLHGSFP